MKPFWGKQYRGVAQPERYPEWRSANGRIARIQLITKIILENEDAKEVIRDPSGHRDRPDSWSERKLEHPWILPER